MRLLLIMTFVLLSSCNLDTSAPWEDNTLTIKKFKNNEGAKPAPSIASAGINAQTNKLTFTGSNLDGVTAITMSDAGFSGYTFKHR